MKIDIITIFPDFLDFGIIRRSREAGLVEITVLDLRAFAHDRHKTVDDRPFGGGEGMLLKPEPIFECVEKLGVTDRARRISEESQETVILLSAQGKRFSQVIAQELCSMNRLVMICGRYEGVDERVATHLADREFSIGDYVLSGGELGAAVIVDAVVRLIPGALGNEASSRQESFSSEAQPRNGDAPSSTCASGGLLDYPHYTRPANFRGWTVPEVLASGNHEEIRRWRRRTALEKTLRNRPDLIEPAELDDDDRALLAEIKSRF
jgi:tRNA (guanine37-N1)-methyltransferase